MSKSRKSQKQIDVHQNSAQLQNATPSAPQSQMVVPKNAVNQLNNTPANMQAPKNSASGGVNNILPPSSPPSPPKPPQQRFGGGQPSNYDAQYDALQKFFAGLGARTEFSSINVNALDRQSAQKALYVNQVVEKYGKKTNNAFYATFMNDSLVVVPENNQNTLYFIPHVFSRTGLSGADDEFTHMGPVEYLMRMAQESPDPVLSRFGFHNIPSADKDRVAQVIGKKGMTRYFGKMTKILSGPYEDLPANRESAQVFLDQNSKYTSEFHQLAEELSAWMQRTNQGKRDFIFVGETNSPFRNFVDTRVLAELTSASYSKIKDEKRARGETAAFVTDAYKDQSNIAGVDVNSREVLNIAFGDTGKITGFRKNVVFTIGADIASGSAHVRPMVAWRNFEMAVPLKGGQVLEDGTYIAADGTVVAPGDLFGKGAKRKRTEFAEIFGIQGNRSRILFTGARVSKSDPETIIVSGAYGAKYASWKGPFQKQYAEMVKDAGMDEYLGSARIENPERVDALVPIDKPRSLLNIAEGIFSARFSNDPEGLKNFAEQWAGISRDQLFLDESKMIIDPQHKTKLLDAAIRSLGEPGGLGKLHYFRVLDRHLSEAQLMTYGHWDDNGDFVSKTIKVGGKEIPFIEGKPLKTGGGTFIVEALNSIGIESEFVFNIRPESVRPRMNIPPDILASLSHYHRNFLTGVMKWSMDPSRQIKNNALNIVQTARASDPSVLTDTSSENAYTALQKTFGIVRADDPEFQKVVQEAVLMAPDDPKQFAKILAKTEFGRKSIQLIDDQTMLIPSAAALYSTMVTDKSGDLIQNWAFKASGLLQRLPDVIARNDKEVMRNYRADYEKVAQKMVEYSENKGVLRKALGANMQRLGGFAEGAAELPEDVVVLSGKYLMKLTGAKDLDELRQRIEANELYIGALRYPISNPTNTIGYARIKLYEDMSKEFRSRYRNPGQNFYMSFGLQQLLLGDFDADRIIGFLSQVKINGQWVGASKLDRTRLREKNLIAAMSNFESEYFANIEALESIRDLDAIKQNPGELLSKIIQADQYGAAFREMQSAKGSVGRTYNAMFRMLYVGGAMVAEGAIDDPDNKNLRWLIGQMGAVPSYPTQTLVDLKSMGQDKAFADFAALMATLRERDDLSYSYRSPEKDNFVPLQGRSAAAAKVLESFIGMGSTMSDEDYRTKLAPSLASYLMKLGDVKSASNTKELASKQRQMADLLLEMRQKGVSGEGMNRLAAIAGFKDYQSMVFAGYDAPFEEKSMLGAVIESGVASRFTKNHEVPENSPIVRAAQLHKDLRERIVSLGKLTGGLSSAITSLRSIGKTGFAASLIEQFFPGAADLMRSKKSSSNFYDYSGEVSASIFTDVERVLAGIQWPKDEEAFAKMFPEKVYDPFYSKMGHVVENLAQAYYSSDKIVSPNAVFNSPEVEKILEKQKKAGLSQRRVGLPAYRTGGIMDRLVYDQNDRLAIFDDKTRVRAREEFTAPEVPDKIMAQLGVYSMAAENEGININKEWAYIAYHQMLPLGADPSQYTIADFAKDEEELLRFGREFYSQSQVPQNWSMSQREWDEYRSVALEAMEYFGAPVRPVKLEKAKQIAADYYRKLVSAVPNFNKEKMTESQIISASQYLAKVYHQKGAITKSDIEDSIKQAGVKLDTAARRQIASNFFKQNQVHSGQVLANAIQAQAQAPLPGNISTAPTVVGSPTQVIAPAANAQPDPLGMPPANAAPAPAVSGAGAPPSPPSRSGGSPPSGGGGGTPPPSPVEPSGGGSGGQPTIHNNMAGATYYVNQIQSEQKLYARPITFSDIEELRYRFDNLSKTIQVVGTKVEDLNGLYENQKKAIVENVEAISSIIENYNRLSAAESANSNGFWGGSYYNEMKRLLSDQAGNYEKSRIQTVLDSLGDFVGTRIKEKIAKSFASPFEDMTPEELRGAQMQYMVAGYSKNWRTRLRQAIRQGYFREGDEDVFEYAGFTLRGEEQILEGAKWIRILNRAISPHSVWSMHAAERVFGIGTRAMQQYEQTQRIVEQSLLGTTSGGVSPMLERLVRRAGMRENVQLGVGQAFESIVGTGQDLMQQLFGENIMARRGIGTAALGSAIMGAGTGIGVATVASILGAAAAGPIGLVAGLGVAGTSLISQIYESSKDRVAGYMAEVEGLDFIGNFHGSWAYLGNFLSGRTLAAQGIPQEIIDRLSAGEPINEVLREQIQVAPRPVQIGLTRSNAQAALGALFGNRPFSYEGRNYSVTGYSYDANADLLYFNLLPEGTGLRPVGDLISRQDAEAVAYRGWQAQYGERYAFQENQEAMRASVYRNLAMLGVQRDPSINELAIQYSHLSVNYPEFIGGLVQGGVVVNPANINSLAEASRAFARSTLIRLGQGYSLDQTLGIVQQENAAARQLAGAVMLSGAVPMSPGYLEALGIDITQYSPEQMNLLNALAGAAANALVANPNTTVNFANPNRWAEMLQTQTPNRLLAAITGYNPQSTNLLQLLGGNEALINAIANSPTAPQYRAFTAGIVGSAMAFGVSAPGQLTAMPDELIQTMGLISEMGYDPTSLITAQLQGRYIGNQPLPIDIQRSVLSSMVSLAGILSEMPQETRRQTLENWIRDTQASAVSTQYTNMFRTAGAFFTGDVEAFMQVAAPFYEAYNPESPFQAELQNAFSQVLGRAVRYDSRYISPLEQVRRSGLPPERVLAGTQYLDTAMRVGSRYGIGGRGFSDQVFAALTPYFTAPTDEIFNIGLNLASAYEESLITSPELGSYIGQVMDDVINGRYSAAVGEYIAGGAQTFYDSMLRYGRPNARFWSQLNAFASGDAFTRSRIMARELGLRELSVYYPAANVEELYRRYIPDDSGLSEAQIRYYTEGVAGSLALQGQYGLPQNLLDRYVSQMITATPEQRQMFEQMLGTYGTTQYASPLASSYVYQLLGGAGGAVPARALYEMEGALDFAGMIERYGASMLPLAGRWRSFSRMTQAQRESFAAYAQNYAEAYYESPEMAAFFARYFGETPENVPLAQMQVMTSRIWNGYQALISYGGAPRTGLIESIASAGAVGRAAAGSVLESGQIAAIYGGDIEQQIMDLVKSALSGNISPTRAAFQTSSLLNVYGTARQSRGLRGQALSLGQAAAKLDPETLNTVQAVLQAYIGAEVEAPGLAPYIRQMLGRSFSGAYTPAETSYLLGGLSVGYGATMTLQSIGVMTPTQAGAFASVFAAASPQMRDFAGGIISGNQFYISRLGAEYGMSQYQLINPATGRLRYQDSISGTEYARMRSGFTDAGAFVPARPFMPSSEWFGSVMQRMGARYGLGGLNALEMYSYELQDAQIGLQAGAAAWQYRFFMANALGGGTLDSQGFVVGGSGAQRAAMLARFGIRTQVPGLTGWMLEDANVRLQRRQQDFNLALQGRGMEIDWEKFWLQGRQWYESYELKQRQFETGNRQTEERFGLQRRQFEYGTAYQAREMEIGRYQQLRQRQWQVEDLAYNRDMMDVQFGFQMRDFAWNLRYARGRERIELLRKQEEATILYGMQSGQLSRQEERFKEQSQWADELFQRQKEHFEQNVRFQKEEMDLSRKHFEENKRLQREAMDMEKRHFEEMRALQLREMEQRRDAFEMQKRFIEEQRQLEDQNRIMQRENELASRQHQLQMAQASAGLAREMNNVQRAMAGVHGYTNDVQQAVSNISTATSRLVEIAKQFLQTVNAAPPPTTAPKTSTGTGRTSLNQFAVGGAVGLGGPIRQMASGGYTGEGLKYESVGIYELHAGEYVVPQEGTPVIRGDNPKTVQLLESILKELQTIRSYGPGRVNATIYTNRQSLNTEELLRRAYIEG